MARVVTGLDRWLAEGPAAAGLPAGARLGLVAHPASIDARGFHAVERMAGDRRWRLTRLFAPEHGLWGHQQDMESVAAEREGRSGLEVISLYGTDVGSLKPARETLDGLDAVLFDLQDVGSRYYTYVYTLSYLMETAAECDVPVVVLDRPNPIGGVRVEGPVLEPAFSSFVGRFPLPVRHGMTAGELARWFAARLGLDADLRVVELRGWSREQTFEDTGLPWVPPSPNMPSVVTARVYPGGCLVEGTNLSEGRGTTTPFELVGAPWIDPVDLATRLRGAGLPGAAFRPASFRPMFQKHAGVGCGGVQVLIRDVDRFLPFETYLSLLVAAREVSGESFDWRRETYEFESDRLAIDLLLGRADLRGAVETATPCDWVALAECWRPELEAFVEQRAEFLLYDGSQG